MPENVELTNIDNTGVVAENKGGLFGSKPVYLGILLATLSSFFFSLCSAIVKGMQDLSPIELAFFRFVGLLPAIPIVVYKEQELFPKGKRILLVLRCFVGTTGLVLSFYAFRHMHLADASVIIFSTPVFVAIFARCFLKEPCGLFNVISIALTLCGIILITRPKFIFGASESAFINGANEDDNINYNVFGPIAACGSLLFSANAYILLRALKSLHYSVIMTNFGVFALIYTIILGWYFGALCLPRCGWDRFLIIGLALFSFSGQILLTRALQIEQCSTVSIARTSDIVFAFIWQIVFFNELPTLYSLAGAVIVIMAVVLSVMRKYLMALPMESSLRKKYKFLTIE